MVGEDGLIALAAKAQFVSRGGIKLRNALDGSGFRSPVARRSTSEPRPAGFTDCLLQAGAASVICVDVGYGILDYGLRSDERVTVLERTNARSFRPRSCRRGRSRTSPSSTSRSSRSPRCLSRCSRVCQADMTCSRSSSHSSRSAVGHVGKGGVVRDGEARRGALVAVGEAALALGAAVTGYHSSGLPGPKGNRETFIALADPVRGIGTRRRERAGRAGARGRALMRAAVLTHRRPPETTRALASSGRGARRRRGARLRCRGGRQARHRAGRRGRRLGGS